MKLQYLLKTTVEDMQALLDSEELSISDPRIDHGDTGLKFMYKLHTKLSQDRAYDDTHPFYVNGKWKRVLPCDGRDYCYMYYDQDGNNTCNDDHVKTLLRAVKKELK